MAIQYQETTLPILLESDVVVVGGSLALAQGGRPMVLIEPRTCLGREITATLRPWLRLDESTVLPSLPAPIRAILPAHDNEHIEDADEIPLCPDTVKRSLEVALLQANVGPLFASLPVGLCQAEDGRTDLVIGNKSVRQILHCSPNAPTAN